MKRKYNKAKAKRLDREDTYAGFDTGKWLWNASRVLRDGNLKEFWEKWKEFTVITAIEERHALLISMTSQVYQIHAMGKVHNARTRNRFHLFKGKISLESEICGCCEGPAEIRHHIVPIKNGGHNAPLNIMCLCKSCHAEIHPWLKEQ